jgi:hypothetical protein
MRSFLLSITPLAVAIGLVAAATAAFAAQDTPFTANGVTAVCTGVGSAKDNPAWPSYPVKIVLANNAGENLASAHYTVTRAGKTLLETDCDAPWLLLKAPAGNYAVSAAIGGVRHSISFSTAGSGPQKELTLVFAAGDRRAAAQ